MKEKNMEEMKENKTHRASKLVEEMKEDNMQQQQAQYSLQHTPMVGSSTFPPWVESLLREKFFAACQMHETAKKNIKNIFCLDCYTSICPHCVSLHQSHHQLQIRRYIYHDVIRLDDLENLIDCHFIQPYWTNKAKVVFLNHRSQSQYFRSSCSSCYMCKRSLQDPYCFCSLSCKAKCYSSGSSASGGVFKFVKKKRSSRPIRSPAIEMAVHVNRRKGIPHRSPLY